MSDFFAWDAVGKKVFLNVEEAKMAIWKGCADEYQNT